MSDTEKKSSKPNSRWTKGNERYSAKDAAILRRIHEENGWRQGAKVTKGGVKLVKV